MKQKRTYLIFCIPVFLFCLTACRRGHEQQNSTETPAQPVERPEFNADSAYAFVAAQCDFGPRVPNTEAHRRCSRYIIETLRSFCDTVIAAQFLHVLGKNFVIHDIKKQTHYPDFMPVCHRHDCQWTGTAVVVKTVP
jgi:hypothetical protein